MVLGVRDIRTKTVKTVAQAAGGIRVAQVVQAAKATMAGVATTVGPRTLAAAVAGTVRLGATQPLSLLQAAVAMERPIVTRGPPTRSAVVVAVALTPRLWPQRPKEAAAAAGVPMVASQQAALEVPTRAAVAAAAHPRAGLGAAA